MIGKHALLAAPARGDRPRLIAAGTDRRERDHRIVLSSAWVCSWCKVCPRLPAHHGHLVIVSALTPSPTCSPTSRTGSWIRASVWAAGGDAERGRRNGRGGSAVLAHVPPQPARRGRGFVVAVLVLFAILRTHDRRGTNRPDTKRVFAPPSMATGSQTSSRRDVLSRVLYGSGFPCSGLRVRRHATVIGLLLGATANYHGGAIGSGIMRLVDPCWCSPILPARGARSCSRRSGPS